MTLSGGGPLGGEQTTEQVCLWTEGSTAATVSGLVDRTWASEQGQSDICRDPGNDGQIVGSYTYHLSDEECVEEGLEPGCPPVLGVLDGSTDHTATNRGMLDLKPGS